MQKLNFATFKEITRLELSFFGLPFVLAGALLPFASFQFFANFRSVDCLRLFWILPAFMAARISGMAFNQLIDARIDGKNKRTQDRPLPSGRATEKQAGAIAWISLFIFILICTFINKTCFSLGLVAAALIVFYSYTKRIHMACHFVLGAVHLLGPIMAAALVSGQFNTSALFLGLMAFFSISANDIIYAIQDHKFDVKAKLHSIPAKLGINRALWIARGCHLMVLWSYMQLAKKSAFPPSSILCVFILAYIYFSFHKKLMHAMKTKDYPQIPKLFKSCNIVVPVVTLIFIFLGVIWSSA